MTKADTSQPQDGRSEDVSIGKVFGTAVDAAKGNKVSVGEVLDAIGTRAYGPLLFLIGLIMASPLGAIPGAPLVAAALVLLLMGQSLAGRSTPWLPARVRRASTDADRFRNGLKRIYPWLRRIDGWVAPRLTALMRPPVHHAWAVVAIVIGLSMIPLGLVPFGVFVPAVALALIGLALMNSDGVLALVASAVALLPLWLGGSAFAGWVL